MILLLEPKERIGLPTTLIRLPRRQCLAERGLAWWALVQCAIGVLATSAAFGLYVYQQLSGGEGLNLWNLHGDRGLARWSGASVCLRHT